MAAEVIDWGFAATVARRMSGVEPFSQSYHADSLVADFEELTAEAEELVAVNTGLRSLAGPARARVTDRSGWIDANLAGFRRLLGPISERLGERIGSSPLSPVARRVAGAEVGAMLGWMSGRVLGQYDLLVVEDVEPEAQDIVYYVGPNVLALEKRFAFPPRQFRLWLALHEVTHRAQFTGIPWLREHYLGLLDQVLGAIDPDPKRFLAAIGRMIDQVRAGHNPLDDGGVATLFASEEQRAALEQVGGLMSLLEGHGDVTMDRAGAHLIPSADRFSRVLRQRRQQSRGLVKLIQSLVGLEAKLAQYQQGEEFIAVVEEAGGPEVLDRAWAGAEWLPSMVEIRDPEAWLRRVGVPTGDALAG